MPPKKKRTRPARSAGDGDTVELPSAEESDGDSSYSASSLDSMMEVQVDFEARMIDESDFHGVRRLLQQSHQTVHTLVYQAFLKAPVDLSRLTDLLIKQARHVGSVVKVVSERADSEDSSSDGEERDGEEDEVYGVTSAINLTHHKDEVCVRQLHDWLLTQCKAYCGGNLSQFTALLSKPTALLINERLLNIPVDIAPLLLKTLLSEVKEAERRHPGEFKVQHYVLLTRSHLLNLPKPKMGKKRKKKAGSGDGAALTSSEAEPVFDFYENELIHRASSLSFSYSVEEESDSVLGGEWDVDDKAMKPYRTIMLIEASKLERCIVELEREIRSN